MAKRKVYRTIETDLFGAVVQDVVNGKVKGDENEREAARLMSKWTGEAFSRVPSSGGMRWKNASIVCGDIVCENEDFKFPFTIETKFYKDFQSPALDGRVLNKRNKLSTFWRQAVDDATRAKRLPMVLARKNGMAKGTYFVLIDAKLYYDYLSNILRVKKHNISQDERSFAVFHSDDLFTFFRYENFAGYVNMYYICE